MDFWFNNNSNINNEEEDLENEKTEENSLSDVDFQSPIKPSPPVREEKKRDEETEEEKHRLHRRSVLSPTTTKALNLMR